MSKTKRDYRKDESRFYDGNKKYNDSHKQHKNDKRIKNLVRSNDIDALSVDYEEMYDRHHN